MNLVCRRRVEETRAEGGRHALPRPGVLPEDALGRPGEEVGAQGDDWEETFEQIKREQEWARELKIEIKSTGDQGNQQNDGEKKEDETE